MSKRTNYNRHFNNENTDESPRVVTSGFSQVAPSESNDSTEEITTTTTSTSYSDSEAVSELLVEVFEEVVEGQVEPPAPPFVGSVTKGCAKLNVRKNPSVDAEVVHVLNEGDGFFIDDKNSTWDFYKVQLPSLTVEGYCMKKFVEIVS